MALLLILLVASSAVSARAYVLYEKADLTTLDVVGASNDLLIGLLNAETGQRGYLLTSNPVYLQPYDAALSTVPADQHRLNSLASAVPGGRQYLTGLKSLVATKMAELAQTIDLTRAGDHAGALRIVGTNKGNQVMDQARGVTADFQRAAATAGASRRSDLRTQLIVFIVLAAILTVAAVIAGVFVRRRLRRSGELAEANQALRVANENRKQFLASMSHELRTPMNAVIGLAELLGGTTLSPPQRRYADGIRAASQTLLSLINDVLDFSKIEAGKLMLSTIDFSPGAIVDDVVEMVAESARSKNLEVTGFYAPSLPATRSGDPDRLRQVLLNLAGNAVKFTERGEITVRAVPDEASAAPGATAEVTSIRFEVTDTGIGISPDTQQQLFEPFVQADSSTTQRHGGSGLGLAICRELVTLMGGIIGVSSMPGHGSTFWCVIPLSPASQADHSVSLNVLAGLHVLIVDDNATNRLILDQQLRAWRAETTLCEGAEAALPLLRGAALRGQPYELSILDLRMPGMDGLALAGAMHADSAIPDHPMIMLSSEVDFDQETADHAGIRAVLVKPVRSADLFATISDVMGLAGPADPAAGTASTASTVSPCGRVLLVEDDELSQLAGEGILTQLGYHVEVASDGQEAVAMATASRYDAIIMDCHMPVMDGFTAARAIHAAEARDRHTPIIALTAAALPEDRARCAAATMDDYLTKPITTAKVDAHLRRWISPAGAAATGPEDDTAAGGPAQRLHDAMSSRLGQFLSDDGLADQVLGDRILRSLLDSLPGKLADLAQSLQHWDVPRLISTAHTIKGMCQNVGATDLADLCDELTGHARDVRDREAAQALTRIQAAARDVLTAATQQPGEHGGTPHPAEERQP